MKISYFAYLVILGVGQHESFDDRMKVGFLKNCVDYIVSVKPDFSLITDAVRMRRLKGRLDFSYYPIEDTIGQLVGKWSDGHNIMVGNCATYSNNHEAMAFCTPVVATNIGSVKWQLNGECGVVLEPADAKALKNAIDRVLEDEGLRNKLIVNGYKKSLRFSLEEQKKGILKFVTKQLSNLSLSCDTRDLNYDKFFTKGNPNLARLEDYHSHNTKRLDIEEMKELLMKLRFVRQDLGLEPKDVATEIKSE